MSPTQTNGSAALDEKRARALAFLQSTENLGIRPGLARMAELMALLGHPEAALPMVHVAGTNGKGSTAKMTASILQAAGYRVGLFTSPAFSSYEDQIQINGAPLAIDALLAGADRLQREVVKMEDPPTAFELLCALAFLSFARQSCDVAVIEVGMGGLLDATNIIPPPRLALITRLGLDHLRMLGPGLQDIARHKAGIIKEGTGACLAYPSEPEALEVLKEQASACQVPFFCAPPAPPARQLVKPDRAGQVFSLPPYQDLFLPLLGRHQVQNACLVLSAVQALQKQGFDLPEAAVRKGLSQVDFPLRMEVLRAKPLLLLDGCHNPQGVAALCDLIEDLFGEQKLSFLLGLLRDKDSAAILDLILPRAKKVYCLTPHHPDRALPAEALAQAILDRGGRAQVLAGDGEALALMRQSPDPLIAFGSFYLVGPLRKAYLAQA